MAGKMKSSRAKIAVQKKRVTVHKKRVVQLKGALKALPLFSAMLRLAHAKISPMGAIVFDDPGLPPGVGPRPDPIMGKCDDPSQRGK